MAEAKKDINDLGWESESTGGELFKFDKVGDNVTGLLISKKNGKTKLGDADFYTIQQSNSEVTFIPTESLGEELTKYLRKHGGLGKVIVSIELAELKKGNYPSPFKVFKVRAAAATEARLTALGINMFDSESETGKDGEENVF